MIAEERFCFFVKVYLPRPEADAFLADAVLPLVGGRAPHGTWGNFFFIRYEDSGYHLRLRFFGNRSAVWGEARREALAALRAARGRFPVVEIKTARYRPEWNRYGGELGVRTAEEIFFASSLSVLRFLKLRRAEPQLSRVEFALASGEALLDALGLEPARRQDIFKVFAARNSRHVSEGASENLVAAYAERLEPLLSRAAGDPKDYWALRHQGLHFATQEFYDLLRPVREAWPETASRLTRPLKTLAQSYLHMHYNRLGLTPLEEHLLKHIRGKRSPSKPIKAAA